MSKEAPGKGGNGSKGGKGGKGRHQTSHEGPRCGGTDHARANYPHFDKTCRKSSKIGHIAPACRFSGQPQQPKGKKGGKNSQRFRQHVLEL